MPLNELIAEWNVIQACKEGSAHMELHTLNLFEDIVFKHQDAFRLIRLFYLQGHFLAYASLVLG